MTVYKTSYRRLFFKIIFICFRNLALLLRPIRSTFRHIWWRYIRSWIFRRNSPAFMFEKCDKKPEEFFTQDGACDDLAKLWFRFDFEHNLDKLKQLVEMFGPKIVIRSVDSIGWTVSHWVAESGTRDALKFIADSDPAIVPIWQIDRSIPLIHLSILMCNLETTDLLLNDYHLDASIKDSHGINAMMRAIFSNQYYFSAFRPHDMILRCFIYGINVNDQDDSGITVLHYAVQHHALQSVYLLLWLGANPILTDYRGRSPYNYALDYGNKQLAKMLEVPWERQKLNELSWRQNLMMYFRLLRYSSANRLSELRYWVGVAIITVQLIIGFLYLLPIYIGYYFDSSSVILPIHVLLIACIVVTIISGYLTVFKDSGFIPTKSEEYLELMRYLGDPNQKALNRCQTLDHLLDEQNRRLCYICQCIAPIKSKHCYHCGRCCLDYDHHCVFLFTCIGRANVNKFIIFTSSLALIGLFGAVVIVFQAIYEYKSVLNPDKDIPYFMWHFWVFIFDKMAFFHFLNLVFCAKFLMIGCALALATIVKKKYLFKASKNKEELIKVVYH